MLNRRSNAPASETEPESTDVRFGMRGLLATMVVVAVASTALRPLLRDLTPGQRGDVLIMWGAAVAMVLLLIVYHARNRLRLERLAGRRLLSLAPRAKFGFVMRPWLVVLGGLIMIAFGLYYLAMIAVIFRRPPNFRVSVAECIMPCLVSAALVSMGIATIWWGRGVQLREHGILRGLKLLRWTHVTAHHWKGNDLYLEGVDQRHRDMQTTVVVGEAVRDAVNRLIAHQLNRQPEVPPEIALGDEEFSEKKPPLVRIRSGTDVTLRGMLTGLTVYVMLVVFVAARPWGRPPTYFVMGIGLGLAIAALSRIVAAMRAGESGPPLVRLIARWDWPSVLGALLLTVGGYYLVQQFVFPPLLVAVGLGTCTGIGAAALAEMMLREKFDLCENGVMLVRWRFLPWSAVRIVRWERKVKGALILRSGWRRLAATVPAEQCEVVERLLVEKLPVEMAPPAQPA